MLGHKIKMYRTLNGWSLEELSQKVAEQGGKISKVALSKFERELINPSITNIKLLSEIFNVTMAELVVPQDYRVKHLGFRKKTSLPKSEQVRYQSIAEAELEKVQWLTEKLSPMLTEKIDPGQFSIGSLDEVEIVAEKTRKIWELGEGPIFNLTSVMERNGYFLKPISGDENFDAYSVVAEGKTGEFLTGMILYNKNYTGDRQRFTLCHELGHFLISTNEQKLIEKSANRFASAFLMSKSETETIIGRKRSNITLTELQEYKKYFGVSIQAIIYRMKDLGIISEQYAKEWYQSINRLGFKKKEPGAEIPKEIPEYLPNLIQRAVAEGFLSRDAAKRRFGIITERDPNEQLSEIEKFMLLPKKERDRILTDQAIAAREYYENDEELREFREFDLDVFE